MPSLKSENPTLVNLPGKYKAAFLAARPKTWIAAFSPVFIGEALAAKEGPISLLFFALTLLFALFIQIGTNYANDSFDFLKGTDTPSRIGPKRAVSSGWLSLQAIKNLAFFSFLVALLLATPLILHAGIWSLWTALLCILFGVLYTGGPKPLGYLGLGEILVLFFFGPLACMGSFFLQRDAISLPVFLSSLAPGLFSTSLLIANNLRDQMSDQQSDKKTLVVRFGMQFGKLEYILSLLLPFLIPPLLVFYFSFPYKLLATLFLLIPASFAIKTAYIAKEPKDFLPLLGQSALLLFFYTLFFSFTLLL